MTYYIIQIALLYTFLIGNTELLIFNNRSLQQEQYSKHVNSKQKNREQMISGVDFKERIKYLGKLTLKNNKKYYVLTSFKTIQAASVKHGQSKIIFLDQDKNKSKEYIVNSPEELPFKVCRNKLYYNYKNEDKNKIETIITEIDPDLPDLLCIENYDCYPSQE